MLPELSLQVLAADNRAKALAVQKMQRHMYGQGYRLEAYLVEVMAVASHSYHATKATQERVKYTVARAAGLDRKERFDIVRSVRMDDRCLVQAGKFDFASEREEAEKTTVTRRGRTVSLTDWQAIWDSEAALTCLLVSYASLGEREGVGRLCLLCCLTSTSAVWPRAGQAWGESFDGARVRSTILVPFLLLGSEEGSRQA